MKILQTLGASLRTCGNTIKWLLAGVSRVLLSARTLVLGVLLIIAILIAYYVLADRYTPFTTDGYVQAYVIQVAPRIEGQVVRVHVLENQAVRKGDLLFEIDPRPFEHRVALLEARLVQAIQQVAQLESELAASRADDARIAAEEAYARAVHEQETQIRRQDATTDRTYLADATRGPQLQHLSRASLPWGSQDRQLGSVSGTGGPFGQPACRARATELDQARPALPGLGDATDAGGIPPPHRGDGECRRVHP